MTRILLAIAVAASVLTANLPAYADQQIDCTIVTKANFALCVIQNANRGHDG